MVCTNGLVCGDTFGSIKIQHTGDVTGRVIEGAYEVLDDFERIDASREAMRAIVLDEDEQYLFARSALSLKYDDPEKPAPITERKILSPRRWEDQSPDLWSVFNRVQENLIKGGLSARSTSGRQTRTRGVQGIDQNLRLNRALWSLAEGMRELKAHAA